MNRIDWLDVAAKCFEITQAKQLHVNDMAKQASHLQLVTTLPTEEIAARLSSALAGNTKRGKESLFARVKNDKGGNKKGIYRIKAPSTPKLIRVDAPAVETAFTGRAGENAVLSELLFRGYNASSMAVDQGIDIVASKNNKYFHIQVKTANGDDSKPYSTTIRKEAFQHASDTFYIVVLRRAQKQRYINDFLILSSSEIRRYVAAGVLREGTNISLRLTADSKGKFLLNGSTDVTHCINDFDIIC